MRWIGLVGIFGFAACTPLWSSDDPGDMSQPDLTQTASPPDFAVPRDFASPIDFPSFFDDPFFEGPLPDLTRSLDLTTSTAAPDDHCNPSGQGLPDSGFGTQQFCPIVSLTAPPPPISGGTLVAMQDGQLAVAADPDRDTIWIVNLTTPKLKSSIALTPGDEPGRGVEDGARRVHIALRGGGAVITVDPALGTIVDRTKVCPAPRGIAYDATLDRIHVACAGGELVTLPAAGGAATRTLLLDRDLRDIIVSGKQLLVSRFRSAELLAIEADGTISSRTTPAGFVSGNVHNGDTFLPAVAWRTIAAPTGGVLMLHQRGLATAINTSSPSSYGGFSSTSAIVHGSISALAPNTPSVAWPAITSAVVPVDLAISPLGDQLAIASAGAASSSTRVLLVPTTPGASTLSQGVVFPSRVTITGQTTAVAFSAFGPLLVQTREPAGLVIVTAEIGGSTSVITVPFGAVSREDTGHDAFHDDAGRSIACASCHPEGGDDGRTWNFLDEGPRRSMSLRGGITDTAPFHWNGDLPDLHSLVGLVYVNRMGGITLSRSQEAALFHWVDSIPVLPHAAPADASSVARGQALFMDQTVGCVGCHYGSHFAGNSVLDVGTGGMFKAPKLVGVGDRAPFLHDGRAAQLIDRFGPTGGGDRHGTTSQLTSAQLADLIAYLDTL